MTPAEARVDREDRPGHTTLRLATTQRIQYDVVLTETPLLAAGERLLGDTLRGRPCFLVIDERVDQLYWGQAAPYFEEHVHLVDKFILPSGEANKTPSQLTRICEQAAQCGLPRDAVFVGMGGGVTSDVAGLAASLYRRGIPYVGIPTTLVAIVDAAVGIKQGVNFEGHKNLIGSYYAHESSLCDLRFLITLPPRELSCGLAEIVKMALVRSEHLLDLVEVNGPALIRSGFQSPRDAAHEITILSQQLMMEELAPNLHENELARLVDFGHTFSPQIESAAAFRGRHGEAVAQDMLLTLGLGTELGITAHALFERVRTLLASLDLPVGLPKSQPERLWRQSLASTRRHRGGKLNLVVPVSVGESVFVQDVPKAAFLRAVEAIQTRERAPVK